MELASYSVEAFTRRRPLTQVSSYNTASCHSFESGDSETATLLRTNSGASSNNGHRRQQLQRNLGLIDVIFYGVGCSVGAGIYSLVGIGAELAGPAIALSFLLCGIACVFTSLAYAEFAARVPLAGSAYTFTYVSFGELCGWLVGWNLTLGYGVSASVVARSWAEYLVGFVEGLFASSTVSLSPWLTKLPLNTFGPNYTCCPLSMLIIGICTVILVTGVKESTRFNTAMTILNLSILFFVLLSGSPSVSIDNLTPIFPNGVSGIAQGAGLVFFSYLGFDMVACLAEECKDPNRNMPLGIIGSLTVSMSIYVAVSLVVVGMAPIALLGEDVPIVNALVANACCSHEEQLQSDASEVCLHLTSDTCNPSQLHHLIQFYGSRLVSFGAIFGLTTATFACLMGQPRINFAAAVDGLLFPVFAKVHPRTGVPTTGTIVTGVLTALIACFVDLESLANAISLGTLQVFSFVNAGVILLRMRPTTVNMQESVSVVDEGGSFAVTASSPLPELLLRSPMVQNPAAEAVLQALGLRKQTSLEIRKYVEKRDSIRLMRVSSNSTGTSLASTVADNGSKPVWLVLCFTLSAFTASAILNHSSPNGNDGSATARWIVLWLCVVAIILTTLMLLALPQSPPPETFTCPMVPAIPLAGLASNAYMMGSMPLSTWKMILVWLLLGLLIYLGYGIHHSELKKQPSTSPDQQSTAATTTYDSVG